MTNPFAGDPDRAAIWEMLVRRDIAAFVARDFSLVADDFVAEGFFGVDGAAASDPDRWRLRFSLDSYRAEWLRQAAAVGHGLDVSAALYQATLLQDIDINGDSAVAHKKFDGFLGADRLFWQTLYLCRRVAGVWKIAGFIGYLPHTMSA